MMSAVSGERRVGRCRSRVFAEETNTTLMPLLFCAKELTKDDKLLVGLRFPRLMGGLSIVAWIMKPLIVVVPVSCAGAFVTIHKTRMDDSIQIVDRTTESLFHIALLCPLRVRIGGCAAPRVFGDPSRRPRW